MTQHKLTIAGGPGATPRVVTYTAELNDETGKLTISCPGVVDFEVNNHGQARAELRVALTPAD